ncbi:MAG: PPK2 family polyphosphate kinase [Flavisolibacter sp.]
MEDLKDISTKAPKDLDKKEIKEKTDHLLDELNQFQEMLYVDARRSVLIILQGMDASGKDGVINKVFSNVNPQGVDVKSFKTPTEEEKNHDFLWRVHASAPAKRMIVIFNRSHYEDVLITRVHGWCDDETAHKRFKAINNFEELLEKHNNTIIFKFYLHISRKEQLARFEERIKDPTKQWKYNSSDYAEGEKWDIYMKMYEDVFKNCNNFPWTIVPSDQNWYKEYVVAKCVVEGLKKLDLKYPTFKTA